MKRVVVLLLGIVCFACQSNGPAVLEGKIDLRGYTQVQLFIKGAEIDSLPIDRETWKFHYSVEVDSPQVFKLFGMVGTGNNRYPIEQAIYIEPGKYYRWQLALHREGTFMSVRERGAENKALIAYNCMKLERISQIYSNKLTVHSFQDSLYKLYQEGKQLVEAYDPTDLVRRYLDMQIYLDYYTAYDGLKVQFLELNQEIPELNHIQLPPCKEVLDDPMALDFYDLRRCVHMQLLKETKQPEEQVQLLQEWFQTVAIRDEIRRYICLVFLDQNSYNAENCERLKKLSVGLEDQEQILKAYEDLRHTSVGAPCPDLLFEDAKGRKHRLSELKGKYVYVDIWASWCRPCCEEVPYLKELEKELKNSQVVFVSISLDEDREAWQEKLKQLDMHGNQWIMTDGDFVKMMNIKSIPHFLLYDKEGKLMQYEADAPSSGEQLKQMLSALK